MERRILSIDEFINENIINESFSDAAFAELEWGYVKSGPAGMEIKPNMIMYFGDDDRAKEIVEYLLLKSGNKKVKNKAVSVKYKGFDFDVTNITKYDSYQINTTTDAIKALTDKEPIIK